MMLRNIILIALLVSSAWTLPLEEYKVAENELDIDTKILVKTGQKFPGVCWACKWAMGKLRQHISVNTPKGSIQKMLHEVCDEIGFLKFLCKNLIARFMGTLIEELSTSDDAKTICCHIGVC